MPFALGARAAWSEEVVIALSGAIVICFLLKLVYHREQSLIWTWAYVPIVALLLVATLQLISLPADLLNIVSPNTATLKTELLGDLPNVGPGTPVLKTMTLSFYPNATKHDLRLILAVAAVFVVVLNVFHRPDQIKRLLMAIALIGSVIALIALAQNLFGNGKIYWFVPTIRETYSGPFVNRNHYGQFMNLSIGAALGYLCVKLREDFIRRKVTLPIVTDYLSCPSAKPLWLLVVVISLGAATVFVSLTRGGMVSMFIAVAFTTLLLTWRRPLKAHGWIMVVIALAAFTCVLYMGFDAVYDRLATLSVLDNYKVRWQILKDLTASYRHFPILGAGLGTHSVVYPMFQHINTTSLFTHAENEYAQAIEETGLIGLALLIILGIIIWSNFARNIRNDKFPICSAAYGLGFGLLAILVHSLSDFGQHVPANAFLSAIFCALLVVLARQGRKQNSATQTVTSSWHFKGLRIAVLIGVSGIWIWSLISANNARIAEHYWAKVLTIEKGLIDKKWQGTDAEFADLISYAASYRISVLAQCLPLV
jgi:O-antigen ligase